MIDPVPPAKTVLLVEDEHSTLRFLMAGLRGLKEFRLVSAENGAEALATLQREPVDVVVTDLNMPVMDGYALITILSQRYPALPVLVLTAVADPALQNQALDLGALQLIPKPPKLSMLMETIRLAAARAPQGMVRGLPLGSVLQLLNWERRSATLTVRQGPATGYLYVRDGELIHAALGREEGLVAAYRMLSWDNLQVEFVYTCKIGRSIDLPLTEILMNLAMVRDQMARRPDPGHDDRWRG